MKKNLKEILEKGTPMQKAILIIENEEAANKPEGSFLTDSDVKSLIQSERDNPRRFKELEQYLEIADKYQINRFRLYGLQENLKKHITRINGFLKTWEQSEKLLEYNNTLIEMLEKEKSVYKDKEFIEGLEDFIHLSMKRWDYDVFFHKMEHSQELRADTSQLLERLDSTIKGYVYGLGVAKAFCVASDEFLAKYNAERVVPNDIKGILQYFKDSDHDIPDIYRKAHYLEILEKKGEENREVQQAAKYAIVPAWSEIEPIGLDKTRKILSL